MGNVTQPFSLTQISLDTYKNAATWATNSPTPRSRERICPRRSPCGYRRTCGSRSTTAPRSGRGRRTTSTSSTCATCSAPSPTGTRSSPRPTAAASPAAGSSPASSTASWCPTTTASRRIASSALSGIRSGGRWVYTIALFRMRFIANMGYDVAVQEDWYQLHGP